MRYGRELLQKPIVSADRNEKLGRIHGYVLDPDERRVAAFVLEQGSGDKSFSIVPFSATKSIYADAVIVENLPGPLSVSDDPRMMELLMKDITLPGSHAITETGMLAGKVADFAFSDRAGELLSLRLDAEPGFPETLDMRKVIKIAKERIIVSGSVYDEKEAAKPRPPAAKRAAEPERPAADAPAAKADFVASGQPAPAEEPVQAPTPEPARAEEPVPPAETGPRPAEASTTPRVDAARMQGLLDQLRKDIISETEALYNSLFREQLRSSFQEAVRLLMDRINSLDPEKHFDKFRERVMDELRAGFAEEMKAAAAQGDVAPEAEAGEDAEPVRALGDLLEEKLEGVVAPKFEAAGERMAQIEKKLLELEEAQKSAQGELVETLKLASAEVKALAGDAAAAAAEGFAKSAGGAEAALKEGLEKINAALADNKAGAELDAEAAAAARGVSDEIAALRGFVESAAAELSAKVAEHAGRRSEMSAGRAAAVEALSAEIENIKSGLSSIKEEITAELADAVGTANAELREVVRDAAKANGEEVAALLRELAKSMGADAHAAAADANAELRENIAAIVREGREGVEKIQENVTNAVRSGYGELKLSVESGAGEIKELIGGLADRAPDAGAFAGAVEKTLEGVKEIVGAGNERLLEGAAAAGAAQKEALEAAAEEARAGREALLVGVREAAAAAGGEIKELLGKLSESVPGADALERTADKLKYELTLILPELLQKNFEELRHKADDIADKVAGGAEGAGLAAEKIIEAMNTALSEPAAAARSVEEKLSGAMEKVALLSEMVETQRAEFRESAMSISDRTAGLVRDDLTALRETADFLKQQPGLLEDMLAGSTEQVSSRIREAAEEIRAGVREAVSEGAALEKIGAMEEAIAGAAERLSQEQKAGMELLEKIQLTVEDRFRAARAETEDALRAELARHADATAGVAGELQKALRNIEINVIGLAEEIKKTDPEELSGRLLGEISSFAGQTVRHEDVAELKKWFEGALGQAAQSARGEALEKLGAAAAAMKSLREETALDVDSFKRDTEKLLEGIKEEVHNQIDYEIQRLQASVDIEALKRVVKGMVDAAVSEVRGRVDDKLGALRSDFQLAAKDGVDIKEIVAAAMAQMPQTAGAIKEEIKKVSDRVENLVRAGEGKAETAAEKIEEMTAGRLEKFESIAAGIEKTLRESSDGILDYVDRRIGERDENIEGAFLKTAEAIEELAKRAPRADFSEILSGRLFGGIFGAGGQKAEPQRSIQAPGAKKKAAGASGIVEAGQVRRLSYLIGKTLVRDVVDAEGNAVARAGDKVGEETIRACRDAHRVLDLIRSADLGAE